MHFRKLVAIVYREFVAHVLSISPHCVTSEEILVYSASLRLKRNGQADTVKCIFQALFQTNPVYQEVATYVAAWIRNPEPLIGVLNSSTHRINNKLPNFTENDFQSYNINRYSWKVCSSCDPFTPSQHTLADIDYIFEVYHNPVNPMSKIMTPKRRRENYVVESQPSKYIPHQPTAEDFHLQPCCSCSAACGGPSSIDLQPTVGIPVLATSKGEPYLAGIVASVEGEVVTVQFPGEGSYKWDCEGSNG
ncbi:zinc finger protein 431-like [Aphis craccivora]|uniref:Zinc finger protein 431-like n=1 Tax=Aphis craccivora TaxID=307492 RepID=A0A6G0YB92_APHCR|nr:zinc finger protein 431-like [Aphis craccivora]